MASRLILTLPRRSRTLPVRCPGAPGELLEGLRVAPAASQERIEVDVSRWYFDIEADEGCPSAAMSK